MNLFGFKKNIIPICIFIHIFSPFYFLFAQTSNNCIPNGSFEMGNVDFESSFTFSNQLVAPGYYSITDNASIINDDFKNPIGGDHSEVGYGMYMVINSDGMKGEKAWCSKVTVLPNSEYDFSVFFCNLYRLLPPKTNFVFENADVKGNDPKIKVTIGNEEILIERDMYHMFRWLKASAVWYSGEHSGPMRICIENLNANAKGNDLALDDISLIYIRTMSDGYKHPEKITTVMHADYTKPFVPQRKVALSEYGIELNKNDTTNQGVYNIHYKKNVQLVVIDTMPVDKIDRIILKDIMFLQSKSDLLPQAKKELDLIYEWMSRDTEVRVRFIGHTDNQGDPKLNVLLSEQRVANVKRYLISKGIAEERVETVGYGGAFPIADNSREESRKFNRRVEMEIINK